MIITKYEGCHLRYTPDGIVLIGVRFRLTGQMRFPPPEFLHNDTDVEAIHLGPTGRLYTFTTVSLGSGEGYSIAFVDFEPGVRVFGRLLGLGKVAPTLGDPVRVVPFILPDGSADYAFAPEE